MFNFQRELHKNWTIAIICFMFVFLPFGCGKKADPKAPKPTPLPVINDLDKTIVGEELHLMWTLPGTDEDEDFRSQLAGFIVHRSKESIKDADCEDCPVLFTRVADIPFEIKGSGSINKDRVEYNEPIKKGFKYIYKVNFYMENGVISEDSNFVDFVY